MELNETQFGQDITGDGNISKGSTSAAADTFADEDFTIHGLLGSKTIDVVAGTTAKDIAEARVDNNPASVSGLFLGI